MLEISQLYFIFKSHGNLNSSISLILKLFMFGMCQFNCMGTCACKCACKGQKKPLVVLLCHCPPIHSRNGFSQTEAQMFLPMLGTSDFSVSTSPRVEVLGMCGTPGLLCGC